MEQLIFLAIAILYGIGVGIYRFVKWANRQITGGSAPNPMQQAIADAQRQAQGPPPTPQAQTPQAPMAQTLAERSANAARTMPRQPQAGGPAVPDTAMDAEIQRRKEELRTENERAYAHYRRRAEELRADEEGLGGNTVLTVPPQSPVLIPAVNNSLFGGSDDLIRAFILSEVLGPPLSRRSPPK